MKRLSLCVYCVYSVCIVRSHRCNYNEIRCGSVGNQNKTSAHIMTKYLRITLRIKFGSTSRCFKGVSMQHIIFLLTRVSNAFPLLHLCILKGNTTVHNRKNLNLIVFDNQGEHWEWFWKWVFPWNNANFITEQLVNDNVLKAYNNHEVMLKSCKM